VVIATTDFGDAVHLRPGATEADTVHVEILNILEGYDLQRFGYLSADHIHLWTEAVKRAYADRNAYLADPE
jgi:gamma-glutamyltranspeptidase / glutathione hydrolase